MSLLDALLLEGYRDPREVYIVLRADGQKGSGTIDDPYDGSRRDYPAVSISSLTKGGAGNLTATAVTSSNHSFATGDWVTINGVGTTQPADKTYVGTFAVDVFSTTSFKYQMLAEPASAQAPGTITCVRERELFDTVMRGIPANSLIHIGPGVFESKGTTPAIPGWVPKSGQKVQGSGWGVTTLKLVNASWPELDYTLIGPNSYANFIEDFEASDLTFDCNIAGQPNQLVDCRAVGIIGSHVRLRRLRAINFSSQTTGYSENFVFAVSAPHPETGKEGVNCIIEDCIAEQPGLNAANNSSVFILSTGENPTDGIMSWHRAFGIRRIWYDGTLIDRPVPIASIAFSISSGLATVTTQIPHNRNNNDWVVIAGAMENGSGESAYNGTYKISNVSTNQFTYNPVEYLGRTGTLPVPTGSPTGDMWVGRFSSHPISVQKLERDSTNHTIAKLTCYGAHNRLPGQWVRVSTVTDPPPAGTEPYYGRLQILNEDPATPNVLRYQMNSAPTVLKVQDDCQGAAGCVQDTVFLAVIGFTNKGFSTDGGSEAVAEGNRVFNTGAGGSYHDTWGTKSQTDRNNCYYDVVSGPDQNMGGSSAPKLGSCLVHNGTVATFTTEQPHGFSAGQSVTISGALVNFSYSNPYNGTFTVLSNPAPTANSFSYSMAPSTPSSNAGGSPVFGTVQTGTLLETAIVAVFGRVGIFHKTGHGFNVGDLISVFGGEDSSVFSAYNGVMEIVAKEADKFTYKLESDPGGNYPGTPKCARAVGASLTASGTTVTLRTVFPHGLQVGQAVQISRPLQRTSDYAGFHRVTAVPNETTIVFELPSAPGAAAAPDHQFGALWQVGLAIRENNLVEIGEAHHASTTWGYSVGVRFLSGAHDSQYVFRSVIARDNIIRLIPGSSNTLARAIQLANVERGLIENNSIDVMRQAPIEVSSSQPLRFFNNHDSSGGIIQPTSGAIDDDIRIRIEDALTLAL